METLLRRMEATHQRIAKLAKLVGHLKSKNQDLTAQLAGLKKELQARDQAFSDLQEKYQAVKLAKQLGNPQDREAVQEKIDIYLKEIDLCLMNLGES